MHPHSEGPLAEWFDVVSDANWQSFADVKKSYNSTDKVGSKTVFDVGGNHYRVVTFIDYESQRVYIRAVLDHKEYDKGNWKNDTFGDDWKPFVKMIQAKQDGRQP